MAALGYSERRLDGRRHHPLAAGGPTDRAARRNTPSRPDSADRYARHLVMPEVGPQGQAKLAQAKVLVVGAGGLGSPALLYLAAAGVGTLGIVDFDTVDLSNLQRQVIHAERPGRACPRRSRLR